MILLAFLAATVCDVRDYGARGDKRTLDTAAIQRAVDECSAPGGGVVHFPRGDFLSGTLFLKSNVTLHLSPGATLWGSRNIADYQPRHLLYARGARNIAIEGGGAINGQGEAFFDENWKRVKERPSPLIELWDCQDVRIEGVTIRNAPGWTIHPKNCERVKIRGISLVNEMRAVNSDGIDPDSSRNVIIADSYIEAGDDCIVLKTTRRGEGPVQPCENVTVTNCVLKSSASALKLGTESHADIRHAVFSNCVIRGSRTGIALLAKDGGRFENIQFSSITIETAPKWGQGVEWPIVVDIERRTAASRLSVIRDVMFSDIQILTKGRIYLSGVPAGPLDSLTFRSVAMRITGFEKVEKAGKLRGGSVEKVEGNLDYGAVPAAIILAHARNVNFRDVRVTWDAGEAPPERHALWVRDAAAFRNEGFEGRAAKPGGKLEAVRLEQVTK